MLNTNAVSAASLEPYYGINAKQLQKHYKLKLSDYKNWNQKSHASDYLLFPENMGEYLALDETAFTNGELYTILTNKSKGGKKGAIVALVKGTKSEDLIKIFSMLASRSRRKVKEVTLGMAPSMNQAVRTCFTKALIVIDRFHVQKLVYDAVQSIRIKFRREAIDAENLAYQKAKESGQTFISKTFSNGDTRKQLLARSRYLLFQSPSRWTTIQEARETILFNEYPDLKRAYFSSIMWALYSGECKVKQVELKRNRDRSGSFWRRQNFSG
ncbi:MAG: DDE transposase [Crocinitomix sp.]|nr:DDE transposase [Crocinitomix sp.]